uniref:RecQ family ATP-dependent DNA helicase n=1 Tax=Prevotella sp. TaxID=59823 RepID=UPI0040291D11
MADKFQSILQKYWGYPDFRGIQRNIIESIASGRDTLGLMPTGGGKSITFQVPALAQEGVCIVITPLIALMKDQVLHLKERGILADAIYADKSRSEILQTLDNTIFGGVKILYVSPERLASEMFQTKLRHIHVSFITVDEAHCISQWGYDFRPSYLQIADIREMKPGVPILALTATATPEVVEDIQEKLHFSEKNVFKMSFERKNLAYVVREAEDKQSEMIHILQSVGGSAIIYARSRKRTKEMAQLLSQQGITATFYHAGLDPDVKDQRQKAWQKDEVRVMCATNAFGMGIDKPDVRMVIHIDCPDSLEAYFQEAGRAGRDGQKSYAVLLYNKHDELKLSKRVEDTFPQKELIQDIYEHLAYFYQIGVGSGQGKTFEFDIEKFCVTYKYFPTKVDAALRILERSGYLHYEDNPDGKARVMFLLGRNDLYLLDQLSPSQDAVVTALLRSYGSLFVDLTYIDEAMIARQAELTIQQVYFALKSLAARHIIKFIPRRKIPFITYTRDRVDGDKVVIPKEVWESRREQYEKRIKSMIHYAKNDEECRSKQLLAYFGEENDSECKQCDVCLANREDDKEKELRMKVAENQIIIEDHHIIEKKD